LFRAPSGASGESNPAPFDAAGLTHRLDAQHALRLHHFNLCRCCAATVPALLSSLLDSSQGLEKIDLCGNTGFPLVYDDGHARPERI
jgi:hypothetical protein